MKKIIGLFFAVLLQVGVYAQIRQDLIGKHIDSEMEGRGETILSFQSVSAASSCNGVVKVEYKDNQLSAIVLTLNNCKDIFQDLSTTINFSNIKTYRGIYVLAKSSNAEAVFQNQGGYYYLKELKSLKTESVLWSISYQGILNLENREPQTASATATKNMTMPKSSNAKVDEVSAFRDGYREYTVKKGEYLWSIARGFKCDPTDLLEVNNLKGKKVFPGQKILICSGGTYTSSSKTETKSNTGETNIKTVVSKENTPSTTSSSSSSSSVLQEENFSLKTYNQEMKTEYEELASEYNALRKNYESLGQEYKELTVDYKKLQDENNKLKLAVKEGVKVEETDELIALKKSLNEMKQKLAQVKAQLDSASPTSTSQGEKNNKNIKKSAERVSSNEVETLKFEKVKDEDLEEGNDIPVEVIDSNALVQVSKEVGKRFADDPLKNVKLRRNIEFGFNLDETTSRATLLEEKSYEFTALYNKDDVSRLVALRFANDQVDLNPKVQVEASLFVEMNKVEYKIKAIGDEIKITSGPSGYKKIKGDHPVMKMLEREKQRTGSRDGRYKVVFLESLTTLKQSLGHESSVMNDLIKIKDSYICGFEFLK